MINSRSEEKESGKGAFAVRSGGGREDEGRLNAYAGYLWEKLWKNEATSRTRRTKCSVVVATQMPDRSFHVAPNGSPCTCSREYHVRRPLGAWTEKVRPDSQKLLHPEARLTG
jgi:hypothetical protein